MVGDTAYRIAVRRGNAVPFRDIPAVPHSGFGGRALTAMTKAAHDTMRTPLIVTFDFYSALVDYETSVAPAVRAVCGDDPAALALTRTWRAKQLEWAQLSNSLQCGRISFRECTRRALVHTFARAGHALSRPDVERLVAAWDQLAPWPEANAALRETKARGYRIAVLSNGDDAMLRAGVRAFDVEFDDVFASDRAGVYKPHPAMYALAVEALGCAPGDILHVAGSAIDALGAKLARLRCAWSNRAGDPPMMPDVLPDHELRDLTGLLDILPEATKDRAPN
jgi:2-haloacid dehalogenase